MRLPISFLAGLSLVVACSSPSSGKNDAGTPANIPCWDATAKTIKPNCSCVDDKDCSADPNTYVCDISGICQQVCALNVDCPSGEICALGQCATPTCAPAKDCSSSQLCLGGKCASPPTPD